jgi:hypothetical protein
MDRSLRDGRPIRRATEVGTACSDARSASMTIAVYTSFLVDVLRKYGPAVELLRSYVRHFKSLIPDIEARY